MRHQRGVAFQAFKALGHWAVGDRIGLELCLATPLDYQAPKTPRHLDCVSGLEESGFSTWLEFDEGDQFAQFVQCLHRLQGSSCTRSNSVIFSKAMSLFGDRGSDRLRLASALPVQVPGTMSAAPWPPPGLSVSISWDSLLWRCLLYRHPLKPCRGPEARSPARVAPTFWTDLALSFARVLCA